MYAYAHVRMYPHMRAYGAYMHVLWVYLCNYELIHIRVFKIAHGYVQQQ